eukprot:TRINITY_DN25157_c0_g1_i1.p1 TRINITY_DN25157_c0_g1~~TRINITY_DN25157_c0_g1_i1.p1  ORF type:complete len:179 (-),score=23.06 TRINITY_DN25157_c0_g1_i1:35-571(-)
MEVHKSSIWHNVQSQIRPINKHFANRWNHSINNEQLLHQSLNDAADKTFQLGNSHSTRRFICLLQSKNLFEMRLDVNNGIFLYLRDGVLYGFDKVYNFGDKKYKKMKDFYIASEKNNTFSHYEDFTSDERLEFPTNVLNLEDNSIVGPPQPEVHPTVGDDDENPGLTESELSELSAFL